MALDYLKTPTKYLFDGTKLLWHQDKLQDFIDGKRITPIHIDMGIHKWCNIKCIYCYGVKQKPSSSYIPLSNLLQLVDDCKELDIRSIAIIGDGEPTLNKGLYDFVVYGGKRKLDMSVATNGLLLDKDKISILIKNLVWLRFNVSGVDKEYSKIMGAPKDSFKKFEEIVKESVRQAELTGCTVGLQMVLIPQCFKQVIPLALKAVEWRVDYLVIKQFSDPEEKIMHFDMSKYDNVMYDLEVAEGLSTKRTKIIIKWSALKDTREITKFKRWDFDGCIDLPFIFQISGDGGCYPCGYLFGDREYCYGNITQTRLKEILRSERYWDVVNKVAKTPLSSLCRGQCRHCETNRFMDRLTKLAERGKSVKEALILMCGSREAYEDMMANPPEHINFV